MKKASTVLFLILASALSVSAQLDIPRRSYPISELEEAKAYAIEKEKPLIFLDT